jgi:hypothetical protein
VEDEGGEPSDDELASWLGREAAQAEIAAQLRVANVIGEISWAERGARPLDWLNRLRMDLGAPPLQFTRRLAEEVLGSLHDVARDDAVRLAYGAGVRTGRALAEQEARERGARHASMDDTSG